MAAPLVACSKVLTTKWRDSAVNIAQSLRSRPSREGSDRAGTLLLALLLELAPRHYVPRGTE